MAEIWMLKLIKCFYFETERPCSGVSLSLCVFTPSVVQRQLWRNNTVSDMFQFVLSRWQNEIKMDNVAPDSSAAEEEDCLDSEVVCLMRVGRNSDWLRLSENTEVQFC